MANMPTPEKPWYRKPAVIGTVVGTVALGGAIAVGAATRGEPGQTQVPATETPSAAAATPKPTDVIATPSGTFKVEVTPTPSPEVKKDVPCQILSPELCATGEYGTLKTSDGESQFIGFKVPPGTPILSPIDGRQTIIKINQPNPVQGFQLSIFPEDRSLSYIFIGDIKAQDSFSKTNTESGRIGTDGIKNFEEGYNLIFTINRFDPNTKRSLVDLDTLKKLFPDAMNKPPKVFSYTGGNSVTVGPAEYYNTKP